MNIGLTDQGPLWPVAELVAEGMIATMGLAVYCLAMGMQMDPGRCRWDKYGRDDWRPGG